MCFAIIEDNVYSFDNARTFTDTHTHTYIYLFLYLKRLSLFFYSERYFMREENMSAVRFRLITF